MSALRSRDSALMNAADDSVGACTSPINSALLGGRHLYHLLPGRDDIGELNRVETTVILVGSQVEWFRSRVCVSGAPHNRPSISRKSRCARRRDGRLRSCGERPLTVPRRHRSPHSVRLARGQRMVAAVVCHWARAADPLRVLLPRPQTPSAAILGVEDPRAQAAGNSRTPANSRPRAAAVATAARIQVPARLPLPRLPSLASVHRDVGDAWTVAKRLPGPLGHPLRRRNGLHPLDQREPRQVLRRDDVGVLPGLLSSSCV
ncbi:MAG: hypothetical protein QOF25_3525 [Mycobacterium sp.]|jgi:hypothetical protein|nr:hypothetical protein [Mycobacterium sp.]